jgi:hypothetical protein
MKTHCGRYPPANIFGSWKGYLLLILVSLFHVPTVLCQQEPQLKIEVVTNEKKLFLNDGDTIELQGEPVTIRIQKVRTFQLAGLEFEYPRDYGFKFVEDATFRSWVFDGNSFVIMLFEFQEKHDLQQIVREMVNRFGKKNCRVEDKKIRLNQLELKGRRINVMLLGAELTFDLFPIELPGNKSFFLAFQDTKSENGADSIEGHETMDLVAQSIRVTR